MHVNDQNEGFTSAEQERGNARIRPLYRGVWAERLQEGDELPTGGSFMALNYRLHLDFSALRVNHSQVNQAFFQAAYAQAEQQIKQWLEGIGSSIDPYLFFVCMNVQNITEQILAVRVSQESEPDQRLGHFDDGVVPNLSGLKGKSQCAERAAVAQYLLQAVGAESAYVGGATIVDAHDADDTPISHSYVVVNSQPDGRAYIFDVARPNRTAQQTLPALLSPSVPLTYDLFAGKEELFVRCLDVLSGEPMYFGIGDPVSGGHVVID